MVCSDCGVHVRKDDVFCWKCGHSLEHPLHCWFCGSPVWKSSRFCACCGTPQPDLEELLQRAVSAERSTLAFPDRRQVEEPAVRPTAPGPSPRAPALAPSTAQTDRLKIVTVLFADVSGFTQMSEKLAPEEVKDIMNECFAGLTEAITARGGTIDKYIGDCVMALFGTPLAREDDPERSLDSALAMQAFLQRFSEDLQQRAGLKLAMRIGINTGEVVAGYVGSGASQEFTVMGDAVNVASRLEHACPVGSILTSYETYRMVRGLYNVRHPEPMQVKGKSAPVRVVEILGRRPVGIELVEHTFRGIPTRMIGRDRELNELQSAFFKSRDTRQPLVVTIRSPMGMGKSRLIFEFASWLLSQGGNELDFMRCRDYRTGSTQAPLLDLLHRQIGIAPDADHQVLQESIRVYLKSLELERPTAERVAGALGQLLGVPAKEILVLAPFADDPEQLDMAIREGILELYRTRIRKGPVVVAVDDLHAASPPFLDLLATLVNFQDLPLLLVVTYRPEADVPVEQRFESCDNRVRISMEPLSSADSDAMVRNLLNRLPAIPPDLVQRITSVSQGRPLFIEEIISDLVERSIIVCGEDCWNIDLSRAQQITLPQSIEAAILSRLDGLPLASRESLQIAAVVGDVCWEGLVHDLGIDQAGVVLSNLEERQFIQFRRQSLVPGEREFLFVLPAVRETVEHHVLKKVKARLHGAVAAWIDSHAKGEHETFDRLLAHHHFEAGNTAKALPFRLRAGQRAEERGDTDRALEDLEWVWQHVRDNIRQAPVDLEQLAETRVGVARLLRRAGQPAQAAAAFSASRESLSVLAQEFPAVDLALRRAGLETARSMVQAAEYKQACELLDQVLQGLGQEDPRSLRLTGAAIKWRAWVQYLEGKHDEALENYHHGISLVESLGASVELGSLLDGLGVCLSKLQRFDESERALHRAQEVFSSVRHREGEAGTLVNLGVLRFRQRRLNEALDYFEEARKLHDRVGDIAIAAVCQANAGDVLLEMGRLEAARSETESALAVFRRMRKLDYQASALQTMIECLNRIDDIEAEGKAVTELLDVSRRIKHDAVQRAALALACRLAVKKTDAVSMASFLQAWAKLGNWGEPERWELRRIIGDVPNHLTSGLSQDIRMLLVEDPGQIK